jgi:hypothetical protein
VSAPTAGEAQALLTALTRALASVAVLALIFTAVNVTLFATSRGVTPAIAILLDPMAALGLATVLYGDARLAAWGLEPPAWSAALRWFTGIAATLMNTWTSIWPDDRIGLPIHADPAGIVLHGVPTVLLILLTETVASYRRTVAELLLRIDCVDPEATPPSPATAAPTVRSVATGPGPETTDRLPPPDLPQDATPEAQPALPAAWFTPGPGHSGPRPASNRPAAPPVTPAGEGRAAGPTGGDVWARAVALDDAARTATGRPVSAWRLRTDLHIGPHRARQIHTQLLNRDHPDGAPPPA